MKFFRSFRFRLALWSALISGFVVLVFGLGTFYLLYVEFLDAVDDEMERFGGDLIEEIDEEGHPKRQEMVKLLDVFDDRRSLQLIMVITPQGETLFRSARWKRYVFEISRKDSDTYRTIRYSGDYWRLAIVNDDDWTTIIATRLDEMIEAAKNILWAFAWALPIAFAVAALGGLLLAQKAVAPVNVITRIAEKINAGGLHKRIPDANAEDELGRLTSVLNAMFERLEASFEQMARFSADASHELNTPLAVMQGELEHTLQSDDLKACDEKILANLLEEVQRLKTITRSLLLFSRSDAGKLCLEKNEIDLGAELAGLLEDVKLDPQADTLSFVGKFKSGYSVFGDGILIRQALYNLLSNAVRYNQPNGKVIIGLQKENTDVMCRIANTGPGIAPRNQGKIFQRFFREDSSRSRQQDGFGLGLSLALEIVNAHGGTLQLEKSDFDETVFCLRLPGAESRPS